MDGFDAGRSGWRPDLNDPRDYRLTHPAVRELAAVLGSPPRSRRLPAGVDLREFLPPAEDQGGLSASAAFAVLSLAGYFDARAAGRPPDASRLFLYQMTLKLLRLPAGADVGLRATFKALARFGGPPEAHWPSTEAQARVDPTDGFLFAFAREYAGMRYLRVGGADGAKTLRAVKAYLAAGLVTAFGFAVPTSLTAEADVPYRPQFDAVRGGHAALAVGYDDARRIASTTGALLFRSSWGPGWGERGYGWLPYEYVTSRAAADFWTALRPDWAAAGVLTRPAPDAG